MGSPWAIRFMGARNPLQRTSFLSVYVWLMFGALGVSDSDGDGSRYAFRSLRSVAASLSGWHVTDSPGAQVPFFVAQVCLFDGTAFRGFTGNQQETCGTFQAKPARTEVNEKQESAVQALA